MERLYRVRDEKAECFQKLMTFRTDAEAVRGFAFACTKEGSGYHTFPEDYVLYYVGEADEETGSITGIPTPLSLISGTQALAALGTTNTSPALEAVN